MGEIPRGRERPNIDFDSHTHRLAFMNSFSANYPELVEDRNIYFLDCTLFHTPDRSRELRRHVGLNPRIQEEVVDDENFMKVISPVKTYDPTKRNLVITCCISGKHRGVAVGELVTVGLDKLFFDGTDDKSSGKVVLCNLSENDHWYGTCKGRCDWCSLKNKAANDKRTDNVATAVRKIKEVMNASPVTTRVTPKFYKACRQSALSNHLRSRVQLSSRKPKTN